MHHTTGVIIRSRPNIRTPDRLLVQQNPRIQARISKAAQRLTKDLAQLQSAAAAVVLNSPAELAMSTTSASVCIHVNYMNASKSLK
jgi:hypothetical protein